MTDRATAEPSTTGPAGGRRIATLAAIGAVAGLLSGSFGVGGGVMIVPALVLLLHYQQRLAHGTSLASVVPIAVVGTIGYLWNDGVDLAMAGLLMVGTVVGAFVGARLLARLPQGVLRWAFIAFMLVSAVGLVLQVPDRGSTLDLDPLAVVGLVLLGLLTGVLSAVLGVGGGVFLVPVLIVFLGVGDVLAKGTSLLVVIPTGLVATWQNWRRDNVDLTAAAAVGLSGAATALLGAAFAVWLDPQPAAILFAVLLVVLAVRMAWQARPRRARD